MKRAKNKHFFELDNRQMLYVFIGFLVIGLMVFSVGVMVGSRSAREDMLRANVEQDPRVKITAPSLVAEKKKIKPEEKSAGIKDVWESALKETVKEKAGDKHPTPPPPEKSIEKVIEDSQVTARKIEVADKARVTAREPLKKSASGKSFFIQVASFQSEKDAEKRAKELAKKGYKTIVVKAEIPEKGVYHRVRLGPFDSLDKAKSFALNFEAKEKVSTFIPGD